jgi:1-acyl-sn-glycerol-3-phosphate acyltransferase
MIRTIIWFLNFTLYQIISSFFWLKYKYLIKAGKKEQAHQYLHKVTSHWARNMVKMSGTKVDISGLNNIPKEENVLFVSNHQGNFDIPLLLGHLPLSVGFVAKVELKKIPMVRTWMELLHCVFLDRKDPRQSLEAIVKGIGYLKEGYSMVIFPEGTRSKGNEMGEFKAGSMKMAVKSKVKIVPVTIKGSYKILEEKGRIQSSQVDIVVHEPVDVASLSVEQTKELHHMIQDIIGSAL